MDPCPENAPTTDRRHALEPSRPAASPAVRDASQPWLQRTIETEIIPRLMLAYRSIPSYHPDLAGHAGTPIAAGEAEHFGQLVLSDDAAACLAHVDALRVRGTSLEQIYLDLLAPAARWLGTQWELDRCDFAQVTLGLWRLQNLVFELAPELTSAWAPPPESPSRAMLAVVPGSQHTLGLLMVAEFFRRAGWDVWADPCASGDELVDAARREWFDVIGLSVGADIHVDLLASVILALRKASRNRSVSIMIGGPILAERPDLADDVGADLSATDARQAVEAADRVAALRPRPA